MKSEGREPMFFGIHLHRTAFGAAQVSRPGNAGFGTGGRTPPYSTCFSSNMKSAISAQESAHITKPAQ